MALIFEGIDGLMPVSGQNISSIAGEALIYLEQTVMLGHELTQGSRERGLHSPMGLSIDHSAGHTRTLIAVKVRLMRTSANDLVSGTYGCACAWKMKSS